MPSRRGRVVNAAGVAAALAEHAEAVCRHYLPHGCRQGRYWVAGDLDGARGRSLFVRLRGPGTPGKWTDAADGSHGDLLDLIRYRSGAPTLRAALAEAQAFLALPASPGRASAAAPVSGDPYDPTQAARRLWRRCRAIDGSHAERYLLARGLARCRFAALRFHPELRYREGSSVRRLPAPSGAAPVEGGAPLQSIGATAMCHVTFQRVADDEARILVDGEYVGDLYRQRDILSPDAVLFIVHLEDDPRGCCRVHERHRVREVAVERILTHPFRC